MREKPTKFEAVRELAGAPLQFDGKEFGYYLDRRPKDFIPPTDEEIDAKHDEMVKEWKSLEYQRLRKPEYPKIEDQLDLLFPSHDQGRLSFTFCISSFQPSIPL